MRPDCIGIEVGTIHSRSQQPPDESCLSWQNGGLANCFSNLLTPNHHGLGTR